jgi:hypothetical protein
MAEVALARRERPGPAEAAQLDGAAQLGDPTRFGGAAWLGGSGAAR